MFGDLIDGISTLIGGMPGTGKTRCMALISILVAGIGKRKSCMPAYRTSPYGQ